MEDPVLNKTASNYQELFNISNERAEELTGYIDLTIKSGYTILSKVAAVFLNKAKDINEQLYMICSATVFINKLVEETGYDIGAVLTPLDEGEEPTTYDTEY